NDVPELTLKDQAVNAINLMDEFKVSHLPVVEHGRYLGLVSQEELEVLEPSKNGMLCHGHDLMDIHVTMNQHILEVLKLAAEHHLTIIPVVTDGVYEGSITLTDLIDAFAKSQAASELGSIIVLVMNDIDYSMQQIAGIIEGNDAKILSASLTSLPGSREVEVTLKINKEDISGIVQTFNRYDYEVKALFQRAADSTDLRSRYDEFMKYLNM
ncbi:MAG: CBS domain-containing protein, partial [Flavobacteriales bacterium]|nr:CBS domain-containing protein [Flavobacteriales bacterium]